MPELPDRSRSGRYIVLLKLFVCLALLLQVGLIFRADQLLLSRPYFEDTFYAMSVSRWLGEGVGFSVDGVSPTNGVQPLICLLYAPLFALADGDLYLGLRLTLLMQVALYCFVAWAAARFLRLSCKRTIDPKLVFWLAFSLIYINYALSIQFLNGLETALMTGLTFLTLTEFSRREEMEERRILPYVGIGLLLGLTVLARIDTAILALALALWKGYSEHRRHGGKIGGERWREFRRMIGQIAGMSIGAFLITFPWWWYNLRTFGNLIPVSGQSQKGLSTDVIAQMIETFNVFLEALTAGIATPASWRIGRIAWFGLVVLLLVGTVFLLSPNLRNVIRRSLAQFRSDWKTSFFAPLWLTILGLVIFYTVIFGAPHFQARYLVLMTVAILLMLLTLLLSTWDRFVEMKQKTAVPGILSFVPFLLFSLSIGFFFRNYTNTYENMMVDTVSWMAENLEGGERVGIFQSGTAGFLYPHNVVNLDGKVNPEAFIAWKEGRLPVYIDSMEFDYIIDWEFYTDRIFSNSSLRAMYQPTDTLRNFMEVWKKIDSGGERNRGGSNP